MKIILTTFFAITVLMACQTKNNSNTESPYSFYVGTYTHGISEGIYKYQLNHDGSLDSIGLAAKSESPSFLALSSDKQYLIAGNEVKKENGEGTVESFKVNGSALEFVDRHASGGAHTCFVGINDKQQVLAANYTGGNVALMQLSAEGLFTEVFDVQQHLGKGTTDRQEGPHAHSIWFVPNSNEVIAVDLGTNQLWFYTVDAKQGKLIPNDQIKLDVAEGAGPRHLVFHPNNKWIYVLNELNNTVALVVKNSDGIYEVLHTTNTLPNNSTAFNTGADIHISNDGRFLYSSNRGHNSLAIFEVDTKSGALKVVGHESTRGDGPRNFSLTPDGKYVLVANQNTNNIVSFKRNEDTGLLTFIDEINAPTPVCVLFE